MRVAIRSAGLVLVSFIGAVLLAFGGATSALAANTALMIGGIAAGTLPDLVMANIQGGAYKNYNRVNVVWPAQAKPFTGANDLTLGASIAIGVTNLKASISQAVDGLTGNDTVTLVGMSAGSLVVDEVLREYQADGDGPSPDKFKIVLLADSSRQADIKGSQFNSTFGYTYQPPVDTPYNIIVATKEYDGTADFPDRVFNLTAVANAIAGGILLHDATFFTDLSTVPASNITVSKPNSLGGVTTSYLIPTDTLPLVTLLPFLKPMEAKLKVTVDKGYSRNDPPKVTAASNVAASTVPTVVPTQTAMDLSDPVLTGKVKVNAQDATVADSDLVSTTPASGTVSPPKKASKPFDGTLKRAIQKLFAGKTPKVAKKTEAAAGDTSTATSSASTSSTSSSASSSTP